MPMNRRDFLKASLSSMAYFSAAATVPNWIAKSAHAIADSIAQDRILVIVQQAGGNDGLNTVIPYADPFYTGDMWRPTLHITSGFESTILDANNALHPKMVRLKDWWDNGNMAIVNNVGYPNSNLSHFVATDYWEWGTSPGAHLTGETDGKKGWAARYFDNACAGVPAENIDPLAMAATGHFLVPKTLAGSDLYTPPAIGDFDFYNIPYPGQDEEPGTLLYNYGEIVKAYSDALGNIPPVNPEADFLQRMQAQATASIDDVAIASGLEPLPGVMYPNGQLGNGLDMASRMIRAGLATRIFYVSQGGYDTHANQIGDDPTEDGDHPRLLDVFDRALHAFLYEMAQSGNLDRVLMLTFSEFGRRVGENGSSGTDHGAGNCVMAFGGPVQQGVYGGQPMLDPDSVNENNGNLGHAVDFRAVYSRVIRDWLQGDPEAVFSSEDWATFGIEEDMEAIPFLAKQGSEEPPPGTDVDNDGDVDATDIQAVVNAALGTGDPGIDADVNDDGVINSTDVQLVINAALGIKTKSHFNSIMPREAARSVKRG